MAKKLIIMAAAGVVSFAGAFVFAWLTHPSAQRHSDVSGPSAAADGQAEQQRSLSEQTPTAAVDAGSGTGGKTMTEQQLKNLVQDIREKMREYDNRLQALTVREGRLQMAQDVLKEDIGKLNDLRVELASTVVNLKSERDRLLKSRLEIDRAERVNLASIAATYDMMDAASAGKILTSMCAVGAEKTQSSEGRGGYGSFDDAVKILHYMAERPKAKVLAELAVAEPALASALCQRLKQIVEGT